MLQTILHYVWTILNSPIGITLAASAVLYILNKIYSKKPLWKQYEGTVIAAIQWAEKTIPDNTPNKSLAKADAALKYILDVYAKTNAGVAPTVTETNELKQGINIVHAQLESNGNLDDKAKVA